MQREADVTQSPFDCPYGRDLKCSYGILEDWAIATVGVAQHVAKGPQTLP